MPLYTEIWGPEGRPLPPLLLLTTLALLVTLVLLDVWGTGSSFSMACRVAQPGVQMAEEQADAGRKRAEVRGWNTY